MSILDIYIARTILHQTMIVFAVLLGLFTFVTLIDQLGDLGVGNFGVFDAIRYVILTIPRSIYELFPMAALLGAILGLSTMAQDSELIVMRASGISLMQIAGAVLKAGAMLVVVAILIGEIVVPSSETMAQRGKAEAMQSNIKQHTNFGLWMRDNQTYVNIGEVLPDLTLLNVRVFEFDENKRLRSLVYSNRGEYDQNAWRLTQVRQTLINQARAESRQAEFASWSTLVTPEILSVFLIKPDQLSAWQLKRYINHLKANSQETSTYRLAFWNKLVLPLSTGVMLFIAIPFVFQQLRSGGLGRSLFGGIMLGLGFYTANKGFGYVVLVSDMPPMFGAVLPTLIFLLVGLILMRKIA